jgi:hypothetical protein
MDGVPGFGQLADELVGYVLVVEGHDVAALGERQQVTQRPVVADGDVPTGQRRAVVRAVGQHVQRLTERDGRLLSHPRELPGPYHAHHGQSGAGVHGRHSIPGTTGAI